MRYVYIVVSIVCLVGGVAASVAFFLGELDQQTCKNLLLIASFGWFVFATAWGAGGWRA